MKVFGLNRTDVEHIVASVSNGRYNGNIGIRDIRDETNTRGRRAMFTLRTADGTLAGARGSGSWSQSGTGPNGTRRTISACWHAHYYVIEALAALYMRRHGSLAGFRVQTAMANYRGDSLDEIREQMAATGSRNVGASAYPVTMPELCEC